MMSSGGLGSGNVTHSRSRQRRKKCQDCYKCGRIQRRTAITWSLAISLLSAINCLRLVSHVSMRYYSTSIHCHYVKTSRFQRNILIVSQSHIFYLHIMSRKRTMRMNSPCATPGLRRAKRPVSSVFVSQIFTHVGPNGSFQHTCI